MGQDAELFGVCEISCTVGRKSIVAHHGGVGLAVQQFVDVFAATGMRINFSGDDAVLLKEPQGGLVFFIRVRFTDVHMLAVQFLKRGDRRIGRNNHDAGQPAVVVGIEHIDNPSEVRAGFFPEPHGEPGLAEHAVVFSRQDGLFKLVGFDEIIELQINAVLAGQLFERCGVRARRDIVDARAGRIGAVNVVDRNFQRQPLVGPHR